MRHITSLLVASLTMAASSSVFGLFAVGGSSQGSPETFDLETSVPGWSASITLDGSSGTWYGPWSENSSEVDPITSFQIQTPEGLFASPNGAITISGVGLGNNLVWTSSGISTIDIQFDEVLAVDPLCVFSGSGSDVFFTVSGGSDPNGYPFFGSGSLDPVPDDSQTWLLLAGVCAAFGVHQVLKRHGIKIG